MILQPRNRPEVWKDVVGFEGLYQISNNGRVKSIERSVLTKRGYMKHVPEKILKLAKGDDGYWDVGLWKDNQPTYFSVHQLVARHFIPNPENKPTVNHVDANKDNNFDFNLEWATHQEQMDHARSLHLYKNNNIDVAKRNLQIAIDAQAVRVRCIQTHEIYCTIAEAARQNNISAFKITRSCMTGCHYNGKSYERLS